MKKLKSFGIISLLVVGLVQQSMQSASASVVDLGAAAGFSVLVTNGNFQSSDSAFQGGNIGVAAPGFSYAQSGGGQTNTQQPITAFINSGSTVGNHPSVVTIDTSHDGFLQQAVTDSLSASSSLAALTPTMTLGNITSATTISKSTVGNYVLSVSSINLNQAALTLSAPAGSTFVLNISGSVTLNGGSQGNGLLLAGGLTPTDVVYNFTSSGGLTTSGGGNAQKIQGIILAPNSAIGLHPGEVDGKIIAKTFSSSSGALVMSPIPEVSAFLPLSAIVLGIGCVETFRRKRSAA